MSDSEKAWGEFCDRLKAIGGKMIRDKHTLTERHETDAIHLLTRTLPAALAMKMENNDPGLPHFTYYDSISNGGGLIAPNLDNSYLIAPLQAGLTYRLSGRTDGLMDINISVHEGWGWEGTGAGVFGDLHFKDLTIRDGAFELIIGKEARPGMDFLAMPETVGYLMIRLYYGDWADVHPYIFIECLDGPQRKLAPLSSADLARQLEAATHWMEGYLQIQSDLMSHWFDGKPINVLPPPVSQKLGGKHIRYGRTAYRIKENEALIVDFEVPQAPYWSIQLSTHPWGDCSNFARTITMLNNRQAHQDADGRVRIVLSHQDPGVKNWLELGGRDEGFVLYRWIWAQTEPTPVTKLVAFDTIAGHLPSDTPHFDVMQRKQQRSARLKHLARRFWF